MDYRGPRNYKEAGVDIEASEKAVKDLVRHLSFSRSGTGRPYPLPNGFAGLVSLGNDRYLSICTDGVGTKMLVAEAVGRFDTVGIDCMAMNVNDMICVGAEPLAFVDYLAVHSPDRDVIAEIGKGLDRAAEMANVSIVGGETAELPDMISGYDLAGTAVGVVEKKDIMDGTSIIPGDAIVGLPSSGIHSNGLTLARKIIEGRGLDLFRYEKDLGRTWGEELLEPTTIYVRPVLEVLREYRVHGMANITGGGLRNLLRMKKGMGYSITDPLPVPPVFRLLREMSGISDEEMHTTFNMGLGMVMVVPGEDAKAVVGSLKGRGIDAAVIGSVEADAVGKVVSGEMTFR